MSDRPRPTRVLQFIGDTDVVAPHLAAMALHRALAVRGLEVRTLALAPGAHGGLEQDVPAIAPGRRSFAARGAARIESKWADVVVVHGSRALTIATLRPRWASSPARVIALWQSPDQDVAPGRSVGRRLLADADRVVAANPAVAEQWSVLFGGLARIDVVRADLEDARRPIVDGEAWSDLLVGTAQ